jgi:hypothetical protein
VLAQYIQIRLIPFLLALPTIKGLPALRKIESAGQVTQAKLPGLTPEFFGADIGRGFRTSAKTLAM